MTGPARCSICGAPVKPEFRPFCSRRCADVDLGRWLNGAYVIPDWRPATEDEREDGEEPGSPPGGSPGEH